MIVTPDLTYLDGALEPGLAIHVEGDRITAVTPATGPGHLRPHVFMPGAQDLQVNGGGGVMLNSAPTPDTLRTMAAAHRALGTTAILPTVITDRPAVIDAAADAAIEVNGEPGQLGLHIEGPHLAPSRKGTHDVNLIRPLDRTTLATVERLRTAGLTVMVTLAPERADPALLAELVATGAIVSAGHTAADADEARAAFEAGVSNVTHLYNAMEPMASRAPGLLAATILSEVPFGIIADGIHVHWDMLRIALAARPRQDRAYLVSDAMATVGGPDHFDLYGQTIHVRDGALVNAEGSLAGAHIDMLTSIRNVHHHAGIPLSQAIAMATDIPRAVLGLPPQVAASGEILSDYIMLDEGLALLPPDQINRTMP
ncbi:N-acetylglucosamine-6-phosphate deacetylase [Pelagovum pacificum]|nr:amidohydrolase family protein [Pelagovum pacificum]